MHSRSRKIAAAIAALGLTSSFTNLHAAVVTWTGLDNSGVWSDGNNWNPANQPASGDTALFNNAGNSQTTVSLGGPQSAGAIQFDTVSAAPYTVGSSSDTLTLTANNISSSVGAISLTSTVANPQSINSSIVFGIAATAPLITNASTTPAAALTLGTTNTTATITPASGTTGITLTVASGATINLNDIITGNVAGVQGSTSATGGLSLTGTGTVSFNGQNTYSGITNLNNSSGGVTVAIGSSSTVSGSTLISGPFGTSTLTPDSSTQSPLQAVGADQTVANPIQLDTGFTVSNAATPYNLTLTGPMILTSSQGRTITVNVPGQTLTLGSAGSPSTITLSTNNTYNLSFDTTANSTLMINDVIKNGAGTNSIVNYSSVGNNTPQGTLLITGANTYSGATSFTAQTSGVSGALTVQVGVSTVGSPGSVTSGPFGTGSIVMNDSNAPPIFEAHGADQTIANALTLTSGFFASADPSGAHNLTFTAPFTDGKTITNNMPTGIALFLGSSSSPSALTFSSPTFQSQIPGGGFTVINDLISGTTGTATYKQDGTYYIDNAANTYSGATVVTGTGAVGSGATIAGTGKVGTGAGVFTVSSTTAATQGGIVSPGGDGAVNLTGIGTLVVPNIALDPLGRYVYQFDPTNATVGGTTNDLISIVGNLNVTGLAGGKFDLNLQPLAAGAPQPQYTLATFASLTGATAGQDVTADISFSGTTPAGYTPTVTVGSGGTSLLLNFAAVPEPGTFSLLGIAGLGLARRRRR